MKVKEFIAELSKLDQDLEVIMSKDGEGNGFSPFADLSEVAYAADSTWSGDIGISELTPELEKAGYSEEDIIEGESAVVLWPTN